MKNQNTQIECLESRTLMSASPVALLGEIHDPTPGVVKPLSPTELAATVAGTHVSLTWADHADNELGFVIFRQGVKGKVTLIGGVGANVTTYTDTTATDVTDSYFVRAYNSAGTSTPSNTVNVTLTSLVTVIAPRKLMSKALSTTSIQIAWTGDYGATRGYVVERSTDGVNFTQIATTAGVKTFTDTGLTIATKYYYRVTAVGPEGHTAMSSVLIGMTKARDKAEHSTGTHETEHETARH